MLKVLIGGCFMFLFFFLFFFYPSSVSPHCALVKDSSASSTSPAQIVCDSVTAFSAYCAGPLAVYMSL